MKKTKILFFLPTLNGGGAERVTVNIINQLEKNKYEILLICLNKNGPLYKFVNKDISIIELNISKTIFSFFKLSKTINKFKPDIVFSSIFRGHIALFFSLFLVRISPKIILRSPNSPKLLIERKELSFVMKKLLDFAYQKADKIIAQTPEMKEEIIKYHFIIPNKIEVFINPIDKNLINEKIKQIENPFDSSKINIVASGRILEQKGFDILIKSFKDVVKYNNLFTLFIIGEDVINEKKNLLKLIKSLDLEKNIYFLGFQENPYKYYYFCDLYVLSSRWEGLPNTILENLYLEKPIVATKCIPFMDKLLTDNENAILVDVENIKQLSNAIVNYKKIKPKKYTQNSDIESIFKLGDKK